MHTELRAILIAADNKNDLWPLDRPRLPFSCMPFFGGMTLLESAWQRLAMIVPKQNIRLLCPPAACALAAELLPELAAENLIPNELGSLAAVHALTEIFGAADARAITIVTRACMIAGDEESFASALHDAAGLARASDCLVACGVPAKEARAGYDYLVAGEASVRARRVQGQDVRSFVLNASLPEAKKALQTSAAWWNTGVYVWPNATFLSEYAAHAHEFTALETCSIEDALLTRTKNLLLLGASFVFSPLRDYEDIARFIRADADGNMRIGNTVLHNAESCLAYNASEKRLLAAGGLKNVLLVQTDDAVFVCPRGDEGALRRVLEELAAKDPRVKHFLE